MDRLKCHSLQIDTTKVGRVRTPIIAMLCNDVIAKLT